MKHHFITILSLLFALFSSAQDTDSTNLDIIRIVDSAQKELTIRKSIHDLPPNGNYYIAKVTMMDGRVKKSVFYEADHSNIYVFADTYEKEIDTIPATEIESVSFREKGRTGKMIGKAAIIGFSSGAVVGYFSKCEDCSEGFDFEGAVRGVWWGILSAAAAASVGALISIFNNGRISIMGDPSKLARSQRRLQKYAVKNWKPRNPF